MNTQNTSIFCRFLRSNIENIQILKRVKLTVVVVTATPIVGGGGGGVGTLASFVTPHGGLLLGKGNRSSEQGEHTTRHSDK